MIALLNYLCLESFDLGVTIFFVFIPFSWSKTYIVLPSAEILNPRIKHDDDAEQKIILPNHAANKNKDLQYIANDQTHFHREAVSFLH